MMNSPHHNNRLNVTLNHPHSSHYQLHITPDHIIDMQLQFILTFLLLKFAASSTPFTAIETHLQCNRDVTQKILCEFTGNFSQADVIEVVSVQPLVPRTLSTDELKDAKDVEINTGELQQMPFMIGHQFHQLQALWIVRCRLILIERQNFIGMQQLVALNLYENQLEHLPGNAFDDLPELEFLDLDNNDLGELHEDLLANQPRLLVFRASNNRIETIGRRLFEGNTKIQQIHLNNNNIREVMVDFRLLQELTAVNLEDNAGFCSVKAGIYDDDDKDIDTIMVQLQWKVEQDCMQGHDEAVMQ
jgi:hypothetical protein